ncbi:MAG: hypothetical protein ACK55I_32765, partial [bacterium]
VEALAERLLHPDVRPSERGRAHRCIALVLELHPVGHALVEHVAEEVELHAPDLEPVRIRLRSCGERLGRRARVRVAHLDLPLEVQPEVSVGAGEDEVPVVARGRAVASEGRSLLAVRERVAHDAAHRLGALLREPPLAGLG